MKRLREPVTQLRWGADLGRRITEGVKRREKRRRENSEVHRCYEYSLRESYRQNAESGRILLDSFDAAFRYVFEHSEVRLGYMQKRLIDVVTIAMLGKFFKHDLVANLKHLRKRFLIEELNDTVAILFPRRSGKTEGSAIMIAVIAVSQPNGNCIMYNLTAMQAKEFLNSVIKYLTVCPPLFVK
jgi:hypothetical protein